MLTIHEDQMQLFSAHSRKQFERRLIAHLLEEFNDELVRSLGTSDEAVVQEFVTYGVDSALAYGIEDKDDVFSLLEIMAELGAEFENKPGCEWAATLLADTTLAPHIRIELLARRLSDDAV